MKRASDDTGLLTRRPMGLGSALVALVIQSLLPLFLGVAVQLAGIGPVSVARQQAAMHAHADHGHAAAPGDTDRGNRHKHGACPLCCHIGVAKLFASPPALAIAGPRITDSLGPAWTLDEAQLVPHPPRHYSARAPPEIG